VALAQRFDPTASDQPQYSWVYPRQIPVDLGGGAVVLKLTPG
jgi:hypothetical protein